MCYLAKIVCRLCIDCVCTMPVFSGWFMLLALDISVLLPLLSMCVMKSYMCNQIVVGSRLIAIKL